MHKGGLAISSKLNDIGDLLVAACIQPTAAIATSATSAGVDLSSVGVDCFGIQNIGTVSSTSVALAGKFQESATATGTFADITGATFAAITSTTGSLIVQTVKFLRTQPFVRYIGTIAGTTPTIALDVMVGGMKVQG